MPACDEVTRKAIHDLAIIVVSFNTREMTLACLASIEHCARDLKVQTIVIDNDSRDGSVAAIKSAFPAVELIENDANLGFAKANNQGFRLARADLVLLLNSDTVLLGDVLQQSVAYLRDPSHAQVGAFGCRVLNSDGSMQPTCYSWPSNADLLIMALGLNRLPWPRRFGRYQLRRWQRDRELDVDVISGCYLLVRRVVMEQVGELDDRFFFFGEETDWCYRMRQAGWILRFAPVGEIIHHGGASARHLNHKRDLLLTESKIRLHRKHDGPVSASATFLILFLFNSLRATFWSLASIAAKTAGDDSAGNDKARSRARHFRSVCRELPTLWRLCWKPQR